MYQDRLATSADVGHFVDTLDNILEKNFQIRTKDLTKDRGILFSHMRVEHSGNLTLGGYEEVQDRQALRITMQLKLDEINATSKTGTLNLVLFRYGASGLAALSNERKSVGDGYPVLSLAVDTFPCT